ncbi:serpin-ZXB-like [Papaver somniferum]|uniref:serpin-ZXB-like n=1 Tax=Papaver somniferum TaxID=3469 RepID=UPI000E7006A4|nr:serpin-ZXB-like [Papaver somniferum]
MYIVLPDRRGGLGDLVEKETTDSASFLNQCLRVDPPSVKTGQFKIPKFKITFSFDATKVLNEMGLVFPFNESEAELTGMVGTRVSVTYVIYKCFIEVDEEGTKAAAATAIVGCYGCSAPPVYIPTVDFVAYHPFIFMIKDSYTGVVLFTEYVLNPLLTS